MSTYEHTWACEHEFIRYVFDFITSSHPIVLNWAMLRCNCAAFQLNLCNFPLPMLTCSPLSSLWIGIPLPLLYIAKHSLYSTHPMDSFSYTISGSSKHFTLNNHTSRVEWGSQDNCNRKYRHDSAPFTDNEFIRMKFGRQAFKSAFKCPAQFRIECIRGLQDINKQWGWSAESVYCALLRDCFYVCPEKGNGFHFAYGIVCEWNEQIHTNLLSAKCNE